MTPVDPYNRTVDYLRISVTDRCNLRCVYCMPPEGVAWRPHDSILRYEEIETVARAAARIGITKVRLTGGEPLVRRGIVSLVRMIAQIPGIDDLSMTTNGVLLNRYAAALAEAGLQRVNVSLDTLDPDRFRRITRRGRLADVLAGIEAARKANLQPVKINTVVIRGLNDDEVVDLAATSREPEGWHVRFIERMDLGGGAELEVGDGRTVTGAEMRTRIEAALGDLTPIRVETGNGPARTYRLTGAPGTVGFITPVSAHFCHTCNRLRLTADGHMRPCLLSNQEMDLRTPLRRGADVEAIAALIETAIARKPQRHPLKAGGEVEGRTMSEIGG